MKHSRHVISVFGALTLTTVLGAFSAINAQEQQSFSKEDVERAKREEGQKVAGAESKDLTCTGPLYLVLDTGNEDLKFTSANYFSMPGGGEGGGFDKTPVLSGTVTLRRGMCLNAHVSAIIGSKQAYGVAALTMLQVTLTPASGGPRHMVGHFERPFGRPSPAVALEAERDVDMYASNFFQKVGTGKHELPPGNYRVDVWWSGAGPGGAIGAAFVLKLYTGK